MKKILTMACLAAMVLGATVTFTSCNNDNDDETSGGMANPQIVFTGGLPKKAAGMTIQTNEKGQIVAIKDGKDVVTFKYREAITRSAKSDPDVVMTQGEGKERLVCNLYLNKDGFVRHCEEIEYDLDGKQEETWDFTYNGDGQLLTMLRSEGGNEKTTIKYQDGNIVETATVSAKEPEESSSYKVYYTSNSITSPIENKGCIMLFDTTFGIDMDEMKYAYYAGLLGKATKHLPARLVDNENYTQNFSWTLNSAGYPISFKGNNETYSFAW
ncbi:MULTISPECIES: DUF4595 domain-containing protein [Prevotellaceae]|uniref:DUF4595 domain-containing protein n=1 Tax=Prevotellaceae TaxID=171552 RepID=UPI0003D2C594|nr:DUF4595 domain-containing protein [Prevotella phocaeensis]ETD21319.1 hypothetical protein HMPREF1199_00389 [Hoylesella oralis CC98A]